MYDLEVTFRGKHVAYLRVFEGRRPYYRAWVEVYGVDWRLAKGPIERLIAMSVYQVLEPGETIYFEYVGDWVTESQLERGVPPEKTRLGKMLSSIGFTSITDMYFPEGFMEGGPKLRARKPFSREERLYQNPQSSNREYTPS
jgi:hypothetical protein